MIRKIPGIIACALVTGAALLQGCDKIKEAAKVDIGMTQKDILFDIPPLAQAGEADIPGATVHYNVDSFINANNNAYKAVNIRDVTVTGCSVDILNGGGDNHWGHLESGNARLASNALSTPVTVAEVTNNPSDAATTLDLPITNASVSSYFNATDFTYFMHVKTRTPLTDTLHCRATVQYKITVGL